MPWSPASRAWPTTARGRVGCGRPHPRDRRATCIYLTERAHAIQEPALAAARDADQELFKGFRRFEKELMLEYIRWAIDNARKL